MKEHPILFNAEMVRAILDGRKTQTRRVMKPQPQGQVPDGGPYSLNLIWKDLTFCEHKQFWYHCPYGKPGDRLWVRETFSIPASNPSADTVIAYRADLQVYSGGHAAYETEDDSWTWKPSIFMPRTTSRILLEVTDVRVERVQEIKERDVKAEGLGWDNGWQGGITFPVRSHAWRAFQDLWDSINDKRGFGWTVNPWCWVVSFKRIKP